GTGFAEDGQAVEVPLGAQLLHQAEEGVDHGQGADRPGAAVLAEEEERDAGGHHQGVEEGEQGAEEDVAGFRPGRAGGAVDEAAPDSVGDCRGAETGAGKRRRVGSRAVAVQGCVTQWLGEKAMATKNTKSHKKKSNRMQ